MLRLWGCHRETLTCGFHSLAKNNLIWRNSFIQHTKIQLTFHRIWPIDSIFYPHRHSLWRNRITLPNSFKSSKCDWRQVRICCLTTHAWAFKRKSIQLIVFWMKKKSPELNKIKTYRSTARFFKLRIMILPSTLYKNKSKIKLSSRKRRMERKGWQNVR